MGLLPDLIADLLPVLKAERGLSWPKLASRTVVPGSHEGYSEGTIKALVKNPGRVPDADIIEALARALDVSPDVFYEYPIAAARRLARTTRQEAERQLARHERPDEGDHDAGSQATRS